MGISKDLSNVAFSAFTLAEVLITLGIIGVVAAMTIPTLMNNIEDLQYKTAYKKAYSNLYQAFNSAVADNSLVEARSYSLRPTPFDENFYAIMSKFKVAKQCISDNSIGDCWDNTGEMFHLAYPNPNSYGFVDVSGMSWAQYWFGGNFLLCDTNGFKKPNQYGKDRFVFKLVDKDDQWEGDVDVPVKVLPYQDNNPYVCDTTLKCATQHNYYGTSWLYK